MLCIRMVDYFKKLVIVCLTLLAALLCEGKPVKFIRHNNFPGIRCDLSKLPRCEAHNWFIYSDGCNFVRCIGGREYKTSHQCPEEKSLNDCPRAKAACNRVRGRFLKSIQDNKTL